MPRYKPGRKGAKAGTNNTAQAAARGKRAADAAEAELRVAAEALAALEAPQPPPADVHPPLDPVPAYKPSKGEFDSHKRMSIIFKYMELKCPPESEWGKHGGTLRQIADLSLIHI